MFRILFASTLALSLLVAPAAVQAKACRDTASGRYVKCTKPAPVRCRDGKSGRYSKCSTARPVRCRDEKGRFTSCSATNAKMDTSTLNKAAEESAKAANAQTPVTNAPSAAAAPTTQMPANMPPQAATTQPARQPAMAQ